MLRDYGEQSYPRCGFRLRCACFAILVLGSFGSTGYGDETTSESAPTQHSQDLASQDFAPQELDPIEIEAPRIPPTTIGPSPTTPYALPPGPYVEPQASPAPAQPTPLAAPTTPAPQPAPATSTPSPALVDAMSEQVLTREVMVRSVPDALSRVPGVLIQKTAPLQASPFVRGFTGYKNVMLIDGLRLNNSAFRAGPVQYWSTIDPYSIERIDIDRGPHSVRYGSDAWGGTIRVTPKQRRSFEPGRHTNTRNIMRYASAERAFYDRMEREGNCGNFGWFAGYTRKVYGDIVAGDDTRLPGTGGADEHAADFRVDGLIGGGWHVAAGFQYLNQTDAPRTERTVDAISFKGTSVGSELKRDHDQRRILAYTSAHYEAPSTRGFIQEADIRLSFHHHEEERDRLRTGGRRDLSSFTLQQIGLETYVTQRTGIGPLTYGLSYYHDDADTFRTDFRPGSAPARNVQGPMGDDASYDLLAAFVEQKIPYGRWTFIGGLRFTYASANADRVDNPAVAGADPLTPGNIISVDGSWSQLTGSLGVDYNLGCGREFYARASTGFRPPSLHDLTSLESSSVVETPAPDLDAEDMWSVELGHRVTTDNARLRTALWYTGLDNTIIRSPTGALIDGVPEVRKDNIGDGWAYGIDVEAAWRFHPAFTLFGHVSYMDAEVQEFDAASGDLVDSPLSRMKPLSGMVALRYDPYKNGDLFAQLEWFASAKEDRLSLRDRADTRRIPPGGTPSWNILNLRAGYRVQDNLYITAGVENILDEYYRVHGSGQNEPGRNIVVGVEIDM